MSTIQQIAESNRRAKLHKSAEMDIDNIDNIYISLKQYLWYRKEVAKKLLKAKSDPEFEHLTALYDLCNEKINLLLAL